MCIQKLFIKRILLFLFHDQQRFPPCISQSHNHCFDSLYNAPVHEPFFPGLPSFVIHLYFPCRISLSNLSVCLLTCATHLSSRLLKPSISYQFLWCIASIILGCTSAEWLYCASSTKYLLPVFVRLCMFLSDRLYIILSHFIHAFVSSVNSK